MFSKSSKSPRPALPTSATGGKSIPFSLIGGDVTITGDLSASVDLHVDGVVEGDIRCAALVQGPDSRIIGHVTAQSARLAGLVDGSIAADELVVESSARITGDVVYERITIEPGSRIEGRFSPKASEASAEIKLLANEAAE
ncbi:MULTISPECIES: bactofilin family protein [Sphingobium]|jgi:cytoskeletal protein CcmA (bactofilin family)|uniref:bactofilin family protein n=1 Tax=Sphingobium TaxID=165695 RepID=UPI000C473A3F|nr:MULTISPECIES: polymer-forming cytoskeletal protein [Sphingobium]MAP44336.1 cell shape determination protein CcmA [Sphingobium sp.]MBA38444.1 cell shape determination protein CcmA [Sphingobium sp.]MBS48483.1 cell shape determination protein CcmA [Sphingobium sp.]MCC4256719.1 polymer-forming cytoskeletal protein [Sphingobium lactosutens]HCW62482.1 cell shape determination protein CcmA [Sphingobium sp.]